VLTTNSMLVYEMLMDRSRTNSFWGIVLFSGTRPTSEKLREMVYGAYQRYRSDVSFLNGVLSSLGGKIVLRQYAGAGAVDITDEKVWLKLSQTQVKCVSLLDDAPTWGIVHFDCATNSDDFTGRRAVYFTVGDENSNADMKIQGGFIPKGSEWKPNDITINFAGGI